MRLSESNIDALSVGLSELHFATRRQRRDLAFWRWRYLQAPFGNNILVVALRGNNVVGMYGLLYLSLAVQGRAVIAGLMADLFIRPSERTWGCYSGLVGMNITESQKENPAFHFGIVPSRITKLTQRVGVISLGRVPIYLGFLDVARILKGLFVPYPLSLAGWIIHPAIGLGHRSIKKIDLNIRPIENFDSTFDDLWSNISRNRVVAIVKNAAYLNWRYGKCSGSYFGCLAAYRERRLEGLITFCINNSRYGSSSILELLARDDNPEIMRALLFQALAELRTKKLGFVTASFPAQLQAGSVLREFGFKPWGARFYFNPELAVASPLVTNPLKESHPALDLKNWDFSVGDWMIS